MERASGERTRDGEKRLEGKEAGLLPPGNRKEGGRGLERCPRRALLRPDRSRAHSPGPCAEPGAGTTPTERRRRGTLVHRGAQKTAVRAYAPSNYNQRKPAGVASGRGGGREGRRTEWERSPCLIFGRKEAKVLP